MSKPHKATPKDEPISRDTYNKAMATCRDCLLLLENMERDAAIRLPYHDYEEVMEALRALVGSHKPGGNLQ